MLRVIADRDGPAREPHCGSVVSVETRLFCGDRPEENTLSPPFFSTRTRMMTPPDSDDPWKDLADALGLPAASEPENAVKNQTGEARPEAARPGLQRPVPASRSTSVSTRRPAPPPAEADWSAVASELGLEADPQPAHREGGSAPRSIPEQPETGGSSLRPEEADSGADSRPQSVRSRSSRRDSPRNASQQPAPQSLTVDDAGTAANRSQADTHDLAEKLASGSQLWDTEPSGPVARSAPAPAPAKDREQPARRVQETDLVADDDGDEPPASRGRGDTDPPIDDAEDRPRKRRRGRRGGRGRSRGRRDEEAAEGSLADTGEELESPFEENAADDRDRKEDREDSGLDACEEPRRSRSRRGRGRRSRKDADDRNRQSSPADREDRSLSDQEPLSKEDDESEIEAVDPVTGEPLETIDTENGGGADDDGDQRRPRRRRGRRGGRRRSKPKSEADAASHEEGQAEPTPTGYVTAGAKSEEPPRRRRDAEGEKSSDGRRRKRRRSRSSDESSSHHGRNRPAFRPVSSSFSQDDEGLEYLGLDDADSLSGSAPGQRSENDPDSAVSESGLDAVREVPSWVEAIGIVIASNLDARAKAPRVDNGRPPRGRTGR
jgi:hypothetical protein